VVYRPKACSNDNNCLTLTTKSTVEYEICLVGRYKQRFFRNINNNDTLWKIKLALNS
jgi:hypothetical protein